MSWAQRHSLRQVCEDACWGWCSQLQTPQKNTAAQEGMCRHPICLTTVARRAVQTAAAGLQLAVHRAVQLCALNRGQERNNFQTHESASALLVGPSTCSPGPWPTTSCRGATTTIPQRQNTLKTVASCRPGSSTPVKVLKRTQGRHTASCECSQALAVYKHDACRCAAVTQASCRPHSASVDSSLQQLLPRCPAAACRSQLA